MKKKPRKFKWKIGKRDDYISGELMEFRSAAALAHCLGIPIKKPRKAKRKKPSP